MDVGKLFNVYAMRVLPVRCLTAEYFWVIVTFIFYCFVANRFVTNRKNEKLKISGQVSHTKAGQPDPQPHVWSAEAPAVLTLLQRHRVSTLS